MRRWFEGSFAKPTPAQALGWPHIAAGDHTLICAPTGSGKTLAAFLWGIDRLARRTAPNPAAPASGKAGRTVASGSLEAEEAAGLGSGVRIVYVSPLKALSYDIERNLRAPLTGIGVDIAVGLRTGDTPQKDRQAMRRKPPDILITTPESLYLMMTSAVREILTGVEAVIVDEIHAVAQSKRGAHLALTLERLSKLVTSNDGPDPQRIGLSATQRPLELVAQFLVGPKRKCRIADAGKPKELDLEIVVPVEDMTEPDASIEKRKDGGDCRLSAAGRRELRRRADGALDLAGDLPGAAEARAGAQLDDHLRQQPPRRGAPGEAAERARQRAGRTGAPGHRALREWLRVDRRKRRSRWHARITARSLTRSASSSRSS